MSTSAFTNVQFDSDGLIPAIVQDADTGDVLMLAYLNQEALQKTRDTGQAHYWSRSRGRLWRKGETSGNVQQVTGVRINCERNSLLIEVKQTGAVCHDGYSTCFYRTLNDDGTLNAIRERVFDPAAVYGSDSDRSGSGMSPAELTQLQFGAYVFLRDHDLMDVSQTSRRLRTTYETYRDRIADELRELAAVLTGKHQHSDFKSDVRLEASQILYWLLLELIRSELTWDHVRLDLALAAPSSGLSVELVANLLVADAEEWQARTYSDDESAAAAHATAALVAQNGTSGSAVTSEPRANSDTASCHAMPRSRAVPTSSACGRLAGIPTRSAPI